MLGDATTLTVLLRDELSEDDQRSLVIREKKRHQTLKAELNMKRHSGAPSNQAASDGSANSFALLYSGLDTCDGVGSYVLRRVSDSLRG